MIPKLAVLASTILIANIAFADDLQIMETDQGVVVEYTGVAEEKKPDPPVAEVPPVAKAPEVPPVESAPQDKAKVVPRSLDEIIKVSNFSVMDVERSYGITKVSAKFDVVNEGPAGSLLVDIVGEGRSGHEMTRILFTQRIGAGQSRTFTTTGPVSNDVASNISRWRMDNIRMSYPRN